MRTSLLLPRVVINGATIALVIGGVVLASQMAPPQWRTTTWLVIYVVAAAVVIIVGGELVRRGRWVYPMRRLEQMALRLGRGEWNVRVQPHGPRTIRNMASHLNALAEQATRQLTDLEAQRGGLQALVDTLPDPILAADAHGKITLLNAPASKLLLLSPQQVIGQKLVNVVSDEGWSRCTKISPATQIPRASPDRSIAKFA